MARRQAGDPWYTVLYREPHTLWWAPGLYILFSVFVVLRFPGDESTGEALSWASALAVFNIGLSYMGWRRARG